MMFYTIRYCITVTNISIGLDNFFGVMYSQSMRHKIQISTASELKMRTLIYFGHDQFKKLRRKQLIIPVKLFKM